MKKIIFTRPDGGLSVVHPVEGARLARKVTIGKDQFVSEKPIPIDQFFRRWPVEGAFADWAETEDQFVARILSKDLPSNAINPQIVEADAIPTDRTYRNAWSHSGSGIAVDMEVAREIQRDILRRMREPLLADLDLVFMKALEQGDVAATKEAALQKQVLRDVTDDPAIEAALTPDALKLVVPEALES
jgi:hypothetical protein